MKEAMEMGNLAINMSLGVNQTQQGRQILQMFHTRIQFEHKSKEFDADYFTGFGEQR